jgi:hypothetical protein
MFKNAQIISRGTNPADYHKQTAARGTPEYFMSPSSLKEFARCAQRWQAGYESPAGSAQRWGNLLDCRLLTPDQFGLRYEVRPDSYDDVVLKCPGCGSISEALKCKKCNANREQSIVEKPWNGNAKECREWESIARMGGREIVSSTELSDCYAAISRLKDDEIISLFLESCERQVLVRGEWHDPATGLVIPVRCLIDLEPRKETEFGLCLGDVKTTFNCGPQFGRHAHKYGYHIQAAFDLDLYNAATGEARNTWCLVAQESFPPWQIGRKMFASDFDANPDGMGGFITLGRSEYRRALANYAWSVKNQTWHDYEVGENVIQGWTELKPEMYQAQQAMDAPKFETPEEEPNAETEDNFDLIP